MKELPQLEQLLQVPGVRQYLSKLLNWRYESSSLEANLICLAESDHFGGVFTLL